MHYETTESVASRVMRFMESMEPKARAWIRAQSCMEKNVRVDEQEPREVCVTPEEVQRMIQMAQNGTRIAEIGHEMKRNAKTVRTALATNGVDVRFLVSRKRNQLSGTVEIGNQIKEEMLRSRKPFFTCYSKLGHNDRIAAESIALVGGIPESMRSAKS